MDSSIWSYDCTTGFIYAFIFMFLTDIWIYCFMNPDIYPDTFLSSALPDQMMMLYIMVCLFVCWLVELFSFLFVFFICLFQNLNFLSAFSSVLFFPLFYDIYLQDLSWIHSLLRNSFSFTRKFLKPSIGILFYFQWFWVLLSRNYDPLEASDFFYLPCFSNFYCNLCIFWFDY